MDLKGFNHVGAGNYPLSQPEAGRQQRQQSGISQLVDVGSLSVAGSSPHGNSLIRLVFSIKKHRKPTVFVANHPV